MEKTTSSSEVDELLEFSYLYDFYGNLLKENHRMIFEDYVQNNLSLAENAAEPAITPQRVYDIVTRCKEGQISLEDKLCLVDKFQRTKDKLQQIEEIAGESQDVEGAQAISALAEQIYEMIQYFISEERR